MNDSQLVIKIILISAFVVFAIILLLPSQGSRRLAIRRIALVLVFAAMAVGVAMPGLVDQVAQLVGVGRGTDLLLYVIFVLFVGQVITSARRHRQLENQITLLARRAAIENQERTPSG